MVARVASIVLAVACLTCAGCDGDGHALIVELRTDFRPGLDFTQVRTTLREGPPLAPTGRPVLVDASSLEDYLGGHRIAEIDDLEPGTYLLEIELVDAASMALASKRVRVMLRGDQAVTAYITSDCLGVICPGTGDPAGATECQSGRCVDPSCTVENAAACPPICTADSDCSTSPSPCAPSTCRGGECLRIPDDGLCDAGEYCDVNDGCRPRPATPVDGGTCACTDLEYCDGVECWPRPLLRIETTDGPGCADLGRDHTTELLWRRIVTGRPNATATQLNRPVACGLPAEAADTFTLDASGRHELDGFFPADGECWGANLGRWEAVIEIDGERSNPVEIGFYNQTCPNVATCPAAADFCSPCRDCAFPNEYCFDGLSCAPIPTLTIETSDSPGCIDLGVDHLDPTFLWRRTITGRPGGTTTQFNEHVSCSAAPTDSGSEVLAGDGIFTDQSFGPASADCNDFFLGRWDAWVEVDTERSAVATVTYFNSQCPAVSTCAMAQGFCPPGG